MKNATEKSVCVLGLGYVGLPTAAVLASRGYTVRGVEVNEEAAKIINTGTAHIVEPELDILVEAAVQTGRLKAFPEPAEADVYLLCVPTPLRGHEPDLSFVEAATQSICPFLRAGNLVVLESTSPPGTTEMIAELIATHTKLAPGDVFVAHAPERVLPGKVLREVVENDRVVGGIDDASTEACVQFYSTFVSGVIHPTHARMAETVKLVENAYRDVNIAFANELSVICEELKLDVWELLELANKHPRVEILSPGTGVGGHCIAVDPWFLIHKTGDTARLMRTAREVNDRKPHWLVKRIKQRAERFKKPRVACLGLAYKPDIDDLRESPALQVAKDLISSLDAEVRIVEPNLESHPDFPLWDCEEAIADADIVVVLVAHTKFKKIPTNLLAEKIIIDPAGALR